MRSIQPPIVIPELVLLHFSSSTQAAILLQDIAMDILSQLLHEVAWELDPVRLEELLTDNRQLALVLGNGNTTLLHVVLQRSKFTFKSPSPQIKIQRPWKFFPELKGAVEEENMLKCVRLLCHAGTDLECMDTEGNTALSLATANGFEKCARILLMEYDAPCGLR